MLLRRISVGWLGTGRRDGEEIAICQQRGVGEEGGDESDSPAIRKETAELADWASNLATQPEEKRRQKGKTPIVIGDLELAITELLITKAFLLNFFPLLEYTWS